MLFSLMYEEEIKKTEMKKMVKGILRSYITVSHVATPLVVIYKKLTADSIDQPSLAFNVLHSVVV